MDMISFDNIKPGRKLWVLGKMLVGKRIVFQINSYPQELKTDFAIKIIRVGRSSYSKYRNFIKRWYYFTKEDLLGWSKPRINEIFDWYILKFENEMYTQEQNP